MLTIEGRERASAPTALQWRTNHAPPPPRQRRTASRPTAMERDAARVARGGRHDPGWLGSAGGLRADDGAALGARRGRAGRRRGGGDRRALRGAGALPEGRARAGGGTRIDTPAAIVALPVRREPQDRGQRGAFVGRATELTRLREALDGVRAGEGRLLLL